MHETRGEKVFEYCYDANGQLYAVSYKANSSTDAVTYYFAHNWRGDITSIYDRDGNMVAKYEYDDWGNVLTVTDIYISVLFLMVSVFNYDGKAFYTDDKIVIAIKVLLYLAVIPVDLFILNKWIIPKCNHKSNSHSKSYGYCLCIIGVVLFREIMRNNYQSVNIQELLKTIAYLFAVVMLINGIYYFMQAFFAKKYSLDILSDYTETYVNSLHRL